MLQLKLLLIVLECCIIVCSMSSRMTTSLVNETNDLIVDDDHDSSDEKLPDVISINPKTNEFSFFIIGDWGKGGESGSTQSQMYEGNSKFRNEKSETKSTNQVAVAKAMAAYATNATLSPEFVVAVGDNFYTKGVYSVTDSLWDTLWRDIYLKYTSLNKLPWYAVFGNHDYGYGLRGVVAQIQRGTLHDEDDQWKMESTNYTIIHRAKDFNPKAPDISIQVIYIDTTTLAPSENGCCNTKGGISEEMQQRLIQNQLTRIENMLQDAQKHPSTWLLVAGHYPVFSRGDHGDTSELHKYLLPLLIEYKVHAYLAGHDHISEHLQYKEIEFFVVGAGCMTDSLKSNSDASLVWSGVGYSAFAAMEVYRDQLTISFIDTTGTNRYTYSLTNPNPSVYDTIQENENDSNKLESSDESNESDEEFSIYEAALVIEEHAYSMTIFVYVLLGFVAVGFPTIYRKTAKALSSTGQFDIEQPFLHKLTAEGEEVVNPETRRNSDATLVISPLMDPNKFLFNIGHKANQTAYENVPIAESVISSLHSDSVDNDDIDWEPGIHFHDENDLDAFFRLTEISSDCSSDILVGSKPSPELGSLPFEDTLDSSNASLLESRLVEQK